jgi:hypothetical protein
MTPYFFFSYAHGDDDEYYSRFYDDLCREVAAVTTRDIADVGFRDVSGIGLGELWRWELVQALRTCECFVSLLSPRLLASSFCGKEWQLFQDRLRGSQQPAAGQPSRLLPVVWRPLGGDLPDVIRDHQRTHGSLGAVYTDKGLLALMKLKKFKDEYKEFLANFARMMTDAVAAAELLPSEGPVDIESTPDAFHPVSAPMQSFPQVPADGATGVDVRPGWQWDVVLSFAGAQRDYVKQVAQALRARGVRCYYDADEQIELWGKYLAEELPVIYSEQAAVVVVFISAEYAARDWTRLERRASLARALQERREYVLPARFDDTSIPGLLSDMVAVDLRERVPQQFAAMIAAKLDTLGITAPSPLSEAGEPARDVEAVPPAGEVRSGWRWDVVLTFAGAQRDYVERVAQALRARGVRCFYDADEQVDLWGKYLAEELPVIYSDKAAAVVVFLSAEYAARDWTRVERRAALNRAVRERREYVLPARVDDTPMPGLLSDMVAVDLRGRAPEQFAAMIAAKLAALGITAPGPSAKAGGFTRDVDATPPAGAVRAGEADLRRPDVHEAISVPEVLEVPAGQPEHVSQDADATEMPEIVSRKGRNDRTVKISVRNQVFISYSHTDGKWLKELQIHLMPYVRNESIAVWDDSMIRAGTIRRESIRQALASAKVAVLLVSPTFLASTFIAEEELPPLLEAAKKEGVAILWVPVRPSSFEVTPIAAYQAVHAPEKPLASLSPTARDKALVKICAMIQQEYLR